MIPLILASATSPPGFFEQFGVDWPHFLAQLATFLIVLWVLKKFAYRPLLDLLKEREERIAETIQKAEQIDKDRAKAEETHKKILADAQADAQRIIDEARKVAQREGDKHLQQAVAEAEHLISKAREATELDRERMMAELKREVGRLVVETTAKVTGKVLTPQDQQRLAEETARELAA
ncbi:MAG: F0F1 ATP synthase subunit B [Verrucomicrobia bacterium]|nr:F0F1 ATP synthase subunit B [Verrucomicrobiota bacterium]